MTNVPMTDLLTQTEFLEVLEQTGAGGGNLRWARGFTTPRAAYEEMSADGLMWLAAQALLAPVDTPALTPWSHDIIDRTDRYLRNAPVVPIGLQMPPSEIIDDIARRHWPYAALALALRAWLHREA